MPVFFIPVLQVVVDRRKVWVERGHARQCGQSVLEPVVHQHRLLDADHELPLLNSRGGCQLQKYSGVPVTTVVAD